MDGRRMCLRAGLCVSFLNGGGNIFLQNSLEIKKKKKIKIKKKIRREFYETYETISFIKDGNRLI